MHERKLLVNCVQNDHKKKAQRSDLNKQSMKHWKSLTKIDLTKKLPLSSTFLEVHFLLRTNQSRLFSVEQIVSKFSEQPTEVITDEDDENEDEESNEQIAYP